MPRVQPPEPASKLMPPIKYVDLSAVRERNHALLRAGRMLFGDVAYSVTTPRNRKYPSRLLDEQGQLLAYCWIDPEDGRPEFKPWCTGCTN